MSRAVVLVLVAVLNGCGGSTAAGDAAPPIDVVSIDASPYPEDPCPATPPACPAAPGSLVRGSGLHVIDRCAFPLVTDSNQTTTLSDMIDALPTQLERVTITDVAADLNRTATRITTSQLPGSAPGVVRAYAWQSGDESVAYWVPQGITGSFDSRAIGNIGGRQIVLVSWHYDQALEPNSTAEKGVRIAIVDVTDPDVVTYRFALLVEPVMEGSRASFRSVPIHAGGLAWVGDRLYVPVTASGFRVFDLSRILRVDGLDDRIGYDTASSHYNAHGYQYVIPQVATYTSTGTCAPRFSFLAIDRSSSPPTLVSGEYDATTINGRLYRWPLADDGTMQLTDRARVIPDGAWISAESHVQGAFAHDTRWWLSSSRPAAGAGELVRSSVGASSTTLGWADSPEDLAFDPHRESVWSVSESVNARYLFEVELSSID